MPKWIVGYLVYTLIDGLVMLLAAHWQYQHKSNMRYWQMHAGWKTCAQISLITFILAAIHVPMGIFEIGSGLTNVMFISLWGISSGFFSLLAWWKRRNGL